MLTWFDLVEAEDRRKDERKKRTPLLKNSLAENNVAVMADSIDFDGLFNFQNSISDRVLLTEMIARTGLWHQFPEDGSYLTPANVARQLEERDHFFYAWASIQRFWDKGE